MKLFEVGRVVKEGLQTAGIWIETQVRNSQIFTNQKKELPSTERASQFKCTSHHSLLRLLKQSSVTQLCPTLCDPMDCSMPSFPVLHYLPEFAQIHVHWVTDAGVGVGVAYEQQTLVFAVLRVGSLRSECQHGRVLGQDLFPFVGRWLFLPSCGEEQRASGPLLIHLKALIPWPQVI